MSSRGPCCGVDLISHGVGVMSCANLSSSRPLAGQPVLWGFFLHPRVQFQPQIQFAFSLSGAILRTGRQDLPTRCPETAASGGKLDLGALWGRGRAAQSRAACPVGTFSWLCLPVPKYLCTEPLFARSPRAQRPSPCCWQSSAVFFTPLSPSSAFPTRSQLQQARGGELRGCSVSPGSWHPAGLGRGVGDEATAPQRAQLQPRLRRG